MEYFTHLQKDKKLAAILTRPLEPLKKEKNIALYLVASIMSQQLNTKVAAIIYGRFLGLYGNRDPSMKEILQTSPGLLRSIGLSNAKVKYVHCVAAFCLENRVTAARLSKMENEEVIQFLTRIKGVGRWTAEMILMFALSREDVFSPDDLGLQQAMIRLYQIRTTDKKKLREKIIRISSGWKPYRTYACIHLWQWKDNRPLKEPV
jgi:DNA-3-methyladenine glycosylase II